MKPKVTVISVVYNDVDNIEATIENVLAQSYQGIEYVIIDGASTDGTLETVKQYENALDKVISEPDKGVYDAMNKGVSVATGDYINFMNAGDLFADDHTIEQVFSNVKGVPDLIYGNHDVVHDSFVKHKQALPLAQIWKHMIFSHQALFTKRPLLQQFPFNLDYKVAADFHFIYNRFLEGYSFQHVERKVAIYQSGGHSELQVINAYKENRRIVMEHDRSWKVQWFHFRLIAKQYLVVLIRSLLPSHWFDRLMALKNTW